MLHEDLEKMDYDDVDGGSNKYRQKQSGRKDLLVLMVVILVFGTALHVFLLTNLLSLDGFEGFRNVWNKNFGDHVDNDLKNIINIDNIDSKNLNEWDKFVPQEKEQHDEKEQKHQPDEQLQELNSEVINQILRDSKIPDNYYDSLHKGQTGLKQEHISLEEQDNSLEVSDNSLEVSEANPQVDLAEILTINPIVLLVNGENILKQERAKQILFSLNMAPELQTINLKKHPNYATILNYLEKLETDGTYDATDIPRLFVSGVPVAGYDDIIDKYEHGQLVTYLREMGMTNLELS